MNPEIESKMPRDRSVQIDQIEERRLALMVAALSGSRSPAVMAYANQIEWATQQLMNTLIDEALPKQAL